MEGLCARRWTHQEKCSARYGLGQPVSSSVVLPSSQVGNLDITRSNRESNESLDVQPIISVYEVQTIETCWAGISCSVALQRQMKLRSEGHTFIESDVTIFTCTAFFLLAHRPSTELEFSRDEGDKSFGDFTWL